MPDNVTLDLTQLLLAVITLVIPVVGAFATAAFRAWADKAGMAADDSRRAVVERAIENGLAMAELMAQRRLPSATDLISETSAYVQRTVPKTLKELGVTSEALDKGILARAARRQQQQNPLANMEAPPS